MDKTSLAKALGLDPGACGHVTNVHHGHCSINEIVIPWEWNFGRGIKDRVFFARRFDHRKPRAEVVDKVLPGPRLRRIWAETGKKKLQEARSQRRKFKNATENPNLSCRL